MICSNVILSFGPLDSRIVYPAGNDKGGRSLNVSQDATSVLI